MCIVVVFLMSMVSLNAQKLFYVATNGSDASLGTEEFPLVSLVGARNAIRKHKKETFESHTYTVIVQDGTYVMQETLELTPEDGGLDDYPIVYKAAKDAHPVFSGGKEIIGFTENSQGFWQVKIPERAYYQWSFDQLYVNGKKAVLARTPNVGFFKIDKVQETIWKQGSSRVAEKAEQAFFFDKEIFNPLREIQENEVENVRLKAYHKWDYTLRYIHGMDKDSCSIISQGKGMKPWNKIKEGGRLVFENYKAALDAQGEWFLDTHGMLYYIPRENETIENAKVIVPVLEQLIVFKGEAIENKYIKNIRFEGLSFEHCHYKIPRSGFEPNQAAAKLNAAVFAEGTQNIVFSNCEISKTGQHALWLGKGCSQILVENSYLHHLGGGGVYIGDFKKYKGKDHSHHITLKNNIIKTGGQEFPPAVGVWLGHSSDNMVTHNDIANFYYTGISVGWVWGYKPSLAKRNTISYNHIHHIGWDLLSDMAGIYTLGASEGTTVENNLIHHIHSFSYGGWGMYADEGSTGILFKNNLVYNTKTGGFQQNYGKENRVKNNILAFAKKYQMQCTVPEKHQSFTFTNNIILFKEGLVAKGAYDNVLAKIDSNIYWNSNGSSYDFNKHTFKEWQKIGFDKHSYLIDPNFKDPNNVDFRFKNKKSYKKINFKPFDYSLSGVYGDFSWIQKAKLSKSIIDAFELAVETNIKKNIKR